MFNFRQRAFSLIELLIVIAIIALLLGILLPAIGLVRAKAKNAAAMAQLESIGNACESYATIFDAYPGLLPDSVTASAGVRNSFTSTENMIISLLGQTTLSGGWSIPGLTPPVRIELDSIGEGPRLDSGRVLDSFYRPKTGELQVITEANQNGGSQNSVPELVDPLTGMPILMFRARSSGTVPVSNDASGNGKFLMYSNADYLWDALTNADNDQYDQRNNSLLCGSGTAGGSAALENMAYLVTNKALSSGTPNDADDAVRGTCVLIAAGADGIYLSKDQLSSASIQSYDDLESFDDIWRVVGTGE